MLAAPLIILNRVLRLSCSSTYDPDGGRVVGLKGLDRNLEVRSRLLGAVGVRCCVGIGSTCGGMHLCCC